MKTAELQFVNSLKDTPLARHFKEKAFLVVLRQNHGDETAATQELQALMAQDQKEEAEAEAQFRAGLGLD